MHKSTLSNIFVKYYRVFQELLDQYLFLCIANAFLCYYKYDTWNFDNQTFLFKMSNLKNTCIHVEKAILWGWIYAYTYYSAQGNNKSTMWNISVKYSRTFQELLDQYLFLFFISVTILYFFIKMYKKSQTCLQVQICKSLKVLDMSSQYLKILR